MDEKETLEALQDALQDFLNHLNEIAGKDIEDDPQAERDRLGETLRTFFYLCDYLAGIGHKVTPEIMGMLNEQIQLLTMLDRGETPSALKRNVVKGKHLDTGKAELRGVVAAAVNALIKHGDCSGVPDAARYIHKRVPALSVDRVKSLHKAQTYNASKADLGIALEINDAAETDNLIKYLNRLVQRHKTKLT